MNLGPQHLLKPLIKDVYNLRMKSYMYKRTAAGAFISKMKEYQLGSVIRRRREVEEQKARFPKEFFT